MQARRKHVRRLPEIAERRIKDPQDRTRLVALVREGAGTVQKGEPLPTVRLREPALNPAPSKPRNGRDDPAGCGERS